MKVKNLFIFLLIIITILLPNMLVHSISLPSKTFNNGAIKNSYSYSNSNYTLFATLNQWQQLKSSNYILTGGINMIAAEGKLPSSISLNITPSTIKMGSTITFSGTLTPAAGNTKITANITTPQAQSYPQELTTYTDVNGNYSLNFTPNQAGNWQVYIKWDGNDNSEASQSELKNFTVEKGISSINLTYSPESPSVRETITITGSVNPQNKQGSVHYLINNPDGATKEEKDLLTQNDGTFTIKFTSDKGGWWSLTVNWVGDSDYSAASKNLSIPVGTKAGLLIIISGFKNSADELLEPINNLSNRMYKTFRERGFTSEDIYYLNNSSFQDADGDGINDIDVSPSTTNLQNAITIWAKGKLSSSVPLYIAMLGHGGNDSLTINGTDRLAPQNLKQWLNQLKQDTGVVDINIFYTSCYSGSFIDDLSANGTIIVTSSKANQASYYIKVLKKWLFADLFWSKIKEGINVKNAFIEGSTKDKALDLQKQEPLLDDNGDSIGTPASLLPSSSDGTLASNRTIGTLAIAPSVPEITSVAYTQYIPRYGEGKIWAFVYDADKITASILPPDFSLPEGRTGEITSVDLGDNFGELKYIGNNKYENSFRTFSKLGEYKIIVDAINAEGDWAEPKSTSVVVFEPGDVNNDGKVNIKDVLKALKLQGQTRTDDYQGNVADYNSDGNITKEDAKAILQKAFGL